MNNQITEEFIKEGKYFSTEELKNRIAKMDFSELDYDSHDRNHYIEIYDRMILKQGNRDVLKFYLKIDPLIFQKKLRSRSTDKIKTIDDNNGKKLKEDKDIKDKKYDQDIHVPIPKADLQHLVPQKISKKNQTKEYDDVFLIDDSLDNDLKAEHKNKLEKKNQDDKKSIFDSESMNSSNQFSLNRQKLTVHKFKPNPNLKVGRNNFIRIEDNNNLVSPMDQKLPEEVEKVKPIGRFFDFNVDKKEFIRFNFNNSRQISNNQENSLDVNVSRNLNSFNTVNGEIDLDVNTKKRQNYLNSYNNPKENIETISLNNSIVDKSSIRSGPNSTKIVLDNSDQLKKNRNERVNNFLNKKAIIKQVSEKKEEEKKLPCYDDIKNHKLDLSEQLKEDIIHKCVIDNSKKVIEVKTSDNEKSRSIEIQKNSISNLKSQDDFKMSCGNSFHITVDTEKTNKIKPCVQMNSETPQVTLKSSSFNLLDYTRLSLYFLVFTLSLLLSYLFINRGTSISHFTLDELVFNPIINTFSITDVMTQYWKYIIIIIMLYVLYKKGLNYWNKFHLAKKIFEKIRMNLKLSFSQDNFEHGLTEDLITSIYSSENNITPEFFKLNILPLLKEMRKKDHNIREFEKKENGKYKIAWQWSG